MAQEAEARRFTVSQDATTCPELRRSTSRQPPQSLQYVVHFVFQKFLDKNRGKRLSLDLNQPEP
jgi:hypothetical protein